MRYNIQKRRHDGDIVTNKTSELYEGEKIVIRPANHDAVSLVVKQGKVYLKYLTLSGMKTVALLTPEDWTEAEA